LVREFFESYNEYIKPLAKAVKNRDFMAISGESHRLKGVALELRINAIVEQTIQFENSARQKNDIECDQLLDKIKSTFNSLKQEILLNE